ncbi:sugar ABC transporter substrate-binding protein [Aneurinibacillus sp. Ricciae_BoGa-3]|uniref:sugar ABC transporter substrate-binding protein n=1 Tax=Aneurinibacillus sp. Ricciae_BoGa-3 TaxID=3022697 RepID=UPI0023419AF8|nr:sugar ABC transporter substrate-binding protein [Aneurinibacillus sp. Ricciae_BoGa-3]WCK55652.1 sugar ABC transporter substrate-binding protein [Aneurinibacillus sp. Ricciae_BoGa-3]
MKKKTLLILSSLLLLAGMVVAGCGRPSGSATASAGAGGPLAGKRIALVMQMNLGTFSAQYISGVKEEVNKLGGQVTVFASDGDLAKMAANLDQAVAQHFDGILTDHGTPEALQKGVQDAVSKGIPVVAFDADLKVPGVTVLEQGDKQMATSVLEKLAKDSGDKGNIVKIWVAGFAPMERRQIAYKQFQQKHPNIKEVAAFGTASNNTALDTQSQMEAILKKYPKKGQITAVFAAWDEFAKGASRAIQQAGRNEIKVYGIDMSDEDLQMIQDPKNPWVASAAVDPKDIGRVQVRYVYQKIHKDQTPQTIVLKPSLITREQLPKQKVTTDQLHNYIKDWGSSQQGIASWMKK